MNPTPSPVSAPSANLVRPLRIAFLKLLDAAPLIVAHERGLFSANGVKVTLSRELGWATVLDKLAYGELEAAPALGPMVLAAEAGLGCHRFEAECPMILSRQGNAITLSTQIPQEEVHTSDGLRQRMLQRRATQPLTFGVVSKLSSHYLLLVAWLRSHGIHPRRDVRIVIVPPALMTRTLEAGQIDGFCAGEPWNTAAVLAGSGWIAATSATLAPNHPEKVLLVRRDTAQRRASEIRGLVAALHSAGQWCADISNRAALIDYLAAAEYLNCPPKLLAASLEGTHLALGSAAEPGVCFSGQSLNRPDGEAARWIYDEMDAAGLLEDCTAPLRTALPRLFRPDLYDQACA